MKCVIFGSAGGVTGHARHNTSLFLHSNDARDAMLVDCNGLAVQRMRKTAFAWTELSHIFITHRHIDHLSALPSFIHQLWLETVMQAPATGRRTAPLYIYGCADALHAVDRLLQALHIYSHPGIFDIVLCELEAGGGQLDAGRITVNHFPVAHNDTPCHGLRITGQQCQLVYSADTQIHDCIYTALRAGDVLVHECLGFGQEPLPGHTNWPQLADYIAQWPPLNVYLVHLPVLEPADEARIWADLEAYQPHSVQLARDEQVIEF